VVVLEDRRRALLPDLERVAPVHEDRRPVGEDRGQSRRPREPGQPGQPLGVRRNVLALVLVGAWHQEAGEPVPLQLGAERLHAGGNVGDRHAANLLIETSATPGASSPPGGGEAILERTRTRRDSITVLQMLWSTVSRMISGMGASRYSPTRRPQAKEPT